MITSIDKKTKYSNSEFKQLIDKEDLVLLDFYADWCGPCKEISPKLEKIGEAYPNIKILKINVESSNDIADNYDIQSLPTILFFLKGKEVHRERGIKNGGTNIIYAIANLILNLKYYNDESDNNDLDAELTNTANEILGKITE